MTRIGRICAICGKRTGATYGFNSILRRNGIPGEKAHRACVAKLAIRKPWPATVPKLSTAQEKVNPETIFSDKPNLIDLTKLERAPDIKCELMPDGWYWATDRASFDPDPESRWYVIGRGKTKREAFYDLLQRLTDVTQQPEPKYEQRGGFTAGAEPPEYVREREWIDE